MKHKFVFKAGWRKVTVYAENYKADTLKARIVLDKRAEEHAPVGWDLKLIEEVQ